MTTNIVRLDTPTYRLLPSDEWSRLEPIFKAYGYELLNPEFATAAVVEHNGLIVGMLILQGIPHFHLEPLWVAEEFRGKVSLSRMVKLLETLMNGAGAYFTFVQRDDENVAGLCRAGGMRELPWRVFVREVNVEVK